MIDPIKRKQCLKRYYESHRQQLIEYAKQYAKTHCKQIREYHKKWRKANPDKVAAYRLRNKKQIDICVKKYNQDNRELINRKERMRYHLKHPNARYLKKYGGDL